MYVKRVEAIQPNFGIRIRMLRCRANLSQQELADLCEMSADQVANIELGKSFAGQSTIPLLADAFGVKAIALFDNSENDSFVKNGGMKGRASRKSSKLIVRNRKVQVEIQPPKRPLK